MLKWYKQPASNFNGQLYREREIVLDEKMIDVLMKIPEAIIVSSWRSLEEQKKMVASGASQTLESNHRRGMAVDIVNWKEIDKKLEALGLVNDIPWDQNHYTLEGESKTAKNYPLINSFIKSESNQYKPSEDMKITKELAKEYESLTGEKPGENLNDSEQNKMAKKIKELRERPVQDTKKLEEEIKDLKQENQDLNKVNSDLSYKADIGNRFIETVKMIKIETK